MQHRLIFAWIALTLALPLEAAESLLPDPASGPPTLSASYPPAAKPERLVGTLKVAGAGKVQIFAQLDQSRLLIKAVGQDGSLIGRAESVVGIGDTPIYIRSTRGLLKLVIHWRS
jgi:hypothetical protein